jgi:hypothetical protein
LKQFYFKNLKGNVMKTMIFILIFFIIANLIFSQVPSNCAVTPVLASEYEMDIKYLALKRIFQIQSPDTALVRIPKDYTDTVAGGMAAIVNAVNNPQRDSIFNLYCVHNRTDNLYGLPGWPYGFTVKVDIAYPWTEAWQNLETITGDTLMDTILVRYSLYIQDFYTSGTGNYAILNTDSIWNPKALEDSLEMVPGVIHATINGHLGGAGKIVFDKISDERYFDFSVEWGDCYSGCFCFYRWKFKVSTDCQVTYLGLENNIGEYCPELPNPSNCDLFSSIEGQFFDNSTFIYPNPSKDKTTISSPLKTGNTQLSIFNVSGEKVMEMKLTYTETQIDISTLPRGVYFVRLQNEKMVEVGKMVKE